MKFAKVALAGITAGLLASSSWAAPELYSDSAKANVLRQYGMTGGNKVTLVTTGTPGVGVQSAASNDGTGVPDQWQMTPDNSSAQKGIATYTLPGLRTVGSYKASWNGSHPAGGGWILEGFVPNTGWTQLASTPGSPTTGTFTPTTV